MKKVGLYLIFIAAIGVIYAYAFYEKKYCLSTLYYLLGAIILAISLKIDDIIGENHGEVKEYVLFSFKNLFSKDGGKRVRLSNILILIGAPFIIVATLGLAIFYL